MVPRRLRLVTCSDDSGCPDNGSKISGLDLASTAFSSPSVNSVPTRLPSRPSRAISTASPIKDSRTSGSYSVTWQRMLSNIHQILSLTIHASYYTHRLWMRGSPRRFRRSMQVYKRMRCFPSSSTARMLAGSYECKASALLDSLCRQSTNYACECDPTRCRSFDWLRGHLISSGLKAE